MVKDFLGISFSATAPPFGYRQGVHRDGMKRVTPIRFHWKDQGKWEVAQRMKDLMLASLFWKSQEDRRMGGEKQSESGDLSSTCIDPRAYGTSARNGAISAREGF